MISGWPAFIHGVLLNKHLGGDNWLQNIADKAAILTHEGYVLAASPGFDILATTAGVPSSAPGREAEVGNALLMAINGGKWPQSKPQFHLGGSPYSLLKYMPEERIHYIGTVKDKMACLMSTRNVIIFASIDPSRQMSDGRLQNINDCFLQVDALYHMIRASEL
jgi:hypothetical protein